MGSGQKMVLIQLLLLCSLICNGASLSIQYGKKYASHTANCQNEEPDQYSLGNDLHITVHCFPFLPR
jgi:hypothetical protein